MQHLALTCHPTTPCTAVCAIVAGLERRSDLLCVSFRLTGDLDQLRIPELGEPRVGSRLWAHTCFEAFVGLADSEAYHEFNFAPSRAWTVYGFRRYRDGGQLDDPALAPEIAVRRTETELELSALIRLSLLSPRRPGATLRLGLTAVVEAADGTLSYWALVHPPGRPDFHHRDTFAVTLEPVSRA